MERRTVRWIAGTVAGLLVISAGGTTVRAAELPPFRDPLDPVRLGRVTARVLTGRVVAAHPLPGGDVCPTAIADAVDLLTDERIAGPLALPWDPARPPADGWDAALPLPEIGVEATVLLDARGRLVAAVSASDGGHAWGRPLVVAGKPSSRFSDVELSWAAFAFRALGGRGDVSHRIRDSSGEERNRWIELAVRSAERSYVRDALADRDGDAGDDVPTDLLLLALPLDDRNGGIALELAARGALPRDLASASVSARSTRLRAGDPAERAAALREATDPRSARVVAEIVANAGAIEFPELRPAVEGMLRAGEKRAAAALVALGATAEDVLEIAPGAAASLSPEEWPAARPVASSKLLARALGSARPHSYGKQRVVLRLARLSVLLPADARAEVLALLPSDPGPVGSEDDVRPLLALLTAVRARLGDDAAFDRLSAVVETGGTLASLQLRETLRLLADLPGPRATGVLLDALAPPPTQRPPRTPGPVCGSSDGSPVAILAHLATRSAEDRAFALARLDARFPPPPDGSDLHRDLRWALGRAPTAAALRSKKPTSYWSEFHAPRGAWGDDEDALRAELQARHEWKPFLVLDGAIPAPLVRDAVAALAEASPRRAPGFDALDLVTEARAPEAVPALRALLAERRRGNVFEVARAIALCEPKADLGRWAADLLAAVECGEEAVPAPHVVAYGLLTAIVGGRR